jgi:hypothetical protein
MIHETLKIGRCITLEKGHDQELIVTLMSLKGSFGNVCLFHTYLVVARMKIKFGKLLRTTKFIQKVINDRNGNLSLIVILLGETKSGDMHQVHSFLSTMTTMRRIRDGTRMDNLTSRKF